MPRILLSLLILVGACLALAQTNVSRPGVYSYTVPAGYRQKQSDQVDFIFSRADTGNLSVLMITTTKTRDKSNEEMRERFLADLKDQQPGQPRIKIHSTEIIKIGGKQVVSVLLAMSKADDTIHQRQIMVLHKGYKVVFLSSYGENYKALDKAFMASLSKVRFL